jgi:hypothetical protein
MLMCMESMLKTTTVTGGGDCERNRKRLDAVLD